MSAPLDADPYAGWARRLAADDPAALAELFDATHDALVRYAAALLRDDAAARDAVQEAFVRVWERRATLDPARPLRALLYRTVRHLAFNATRDARTRARLLEGAPDAAAPWRPPAPDDWAVARDLGRRLRRWMGALPARQQEALALSRFDGLSHDEIAAVMGCAPRTVNNHLVRALATLRDRLAGEPPADAAADMAAGQPGHRRPASLLAASAPAVAPPAPVSAQ